MSRQWIIRTIDEKERLIEEMDPDIVVIRVRKESLEKFWEAKRRRLQKIAWALVGVCLWLFFTVASLFLLIYVFEHYQAIPAILSSPEKTKVLLLAGWAVMCCGCVWIPFEYRDHVLKRETEENRMTISEYGDFPPDEILVPHEDLSISMRQLDEPVKKYILLPVGMRL